MIWPTSPFKFDINLIIIEPKRVQTIQLICARVSTLACRVLLANNGRAILLDGSLHDKVYFWATIKGLNIHNSKNTSIKYENESRP